MVHWGSFIQIMAVLFLKWEKKMGMFKSQWEQSRYTRKLLNIGEKRDDCSLSIKKSKVYMEGMA